MAKWFFLAFVVLTFVAVNATALGTQLSIGATVFAIVTVNIFAASLLAIWLGSYYLRYRAVGFPVGHAALMLSAGLGFIGLGSNGLLSGTCAFLVSGQAIPGSISRLASWAMENDACTDLSLLLLLFGIFMLWPTLKLLYGVARRPTETI